ncbi:AMP-dependent synthetase and ligase family protein isoform 1 [Hibiscus syriacus]|uniref:AMP-dependent synthetase and ligase family protein isoform 1 n=1 Tax=Hibiscus syriacus TaxID=106335 RepID=A0A6A3B5M9_HIBSY|nr:heavy metal-associated isoprenylated plant protein 3-like isoform X2 [Hibiscus syriacus]KAE8711178.1 AMP-dependent synthetase and ligase family protein isoform 1 [Hibiscus syriacus]
MGEKNNGNKKSGDKEKKENGPLTVVFKVDCLCEGCSSKILKCVRELEGVETVKTESNTNKVTVIGAVDPTAIKDNIAKKSKKKVDFVAPQPKKDDNIEEKKEKKSDKDKNQGSGNKQDKKPKEAALTTADLKVQLKCQCQGCILKIRKIVSETKGVHELKVDTQKEMLTVKGTMDVKALAEALKDKLKKNVEIVPPKKEKDNNKEGGKTGAGSDGGNSGGGGSGVGGKKKNKGGNASVDGGNDDNANGNANANAGTADCGGGKNKKEGKRTEFMVQPEYGYGYTPGYPGYMPSYPGYGQPGYGYCYGHPHPHGYGHHYPGYVPNYPVFVQPPHQMFNDENPNDCSIL